MRWRGARPRRTQCTILGASSLCKRCIDPASLDALTMGILMGRRQSGLRVATAAYVPGHLARAWPRTPQRSCRPAASGSAYAAGMPRASSRRPRRSLAASLALARSCSQPSCTPRTASLACAGLPPPVSLTLSSHAWHALTLRPSWQANTGLLSHQYSGGNNHRVCL